MDAVSRSVPMEKTYCHSPASRVFPNVTVSGAYGDANTDSATTGLAHYDTQKQMDTP